MASIKDSLNNSKDSTLMLLSQTKLIRCQKIGEPSVAPNIFTVRSTQEILPAAILYRDGGQLPKCEMEEDSLLLTHKLQSFVS